MNFKIDYGTNNIRTPEEKLRICLLLLSGKKGLVSAETFSMKLLCTGLSFQNLIKLF